MSESDSNGDSEQYECPWDGCGRVFDTDRGLKVHHSRIHDESIANSDPVPDAGPYECSVCGDLFPSTQALGGHVTHHQNESGRVECPTCGRSFASRHALGTHHGLAHDESLIEYEARQKRQNAKYSCPLCEKGCKSRTALGIHYGRSHEDMGPLKDLMIERLREFAEELDRVPKTEDLSSSETDIWTQKVYHDRFGSVQEALKQAGLAKRGRYRNIPKPDLEEELRRVYEKIGKAPTTTNMDRIGEYSYNTYISTFGSWSAACGAAGVPAPDFYGQNNPMWRGGKSISDAVRKCIGSESWYATASRVRERDDRTCQKCSKEATSRRLDGHHIVPIISGGCNAEELVMTLCIRCHRTVESYTRDIFDPILIDWSDSELPDGRERWTPDAASFP